MRLHIAAEDLGLYLHEESQRATTKLPSAARELARIQNDAQELKSLISVAAESISGKSRAQVRTVITELAEMDRVKSRMEAARDTLQEATGLSSLLRSIDALMQRKDLVRLAEALQALKKGLAVVGTSVPEFGEGQQKLEHVEREVVENAFQKLCVSLEEQDGGESSQLCNILLQLHREDRIREAYMGARAKPILSLWEGYTLGTPFVSWISTFYDELLRSCAPECEWCKTYIQELYPDMVLKMYHQFFMKIETPCKARLASAISQSGVSHLQAIESIEQALDATADFISGFWDILMDAGAITMNEESHLMQQIIESVASPYEDAMLRYPEKERGYLLTSLQSHMDRIGTQLDTDVDGEPVLKESVEFSFGLLSGSLNRCSRATHGSMMPQIVHIIDEVFASYLENLRNILNKKTFISEVESAASLLYLSPLLHLLEEKFEALRDEISDHVLEVRSSVLNVIEEDEMSVLKSPVKLRGTQFLAVMRVASNSVLASELNALVSGDPNLSTSILAIRRLRTFVENLLEERLLSKVYTLFKEVSSISTISTNAADEGLPQFSSYPLQYMISAGENLMMLPQLLESAWGGMKTTDDEVGNWIDRLSLSACKYYCTRLDSLEALSSTGVQQLSADVEYFCNILNSLGQEVPESLTAWQVALNTPDIDSMKQVLQNIEKDSNAYRIVRHVSKLRCMEP